jgi:hypothetical protein
MELKVIRADRERINQATEKLYKNSVMTEPKLHGIVEEAYYHQMGDRWSLIRDANVKTLAFGQHIRPDGLKSKRIDDDLVIEVAGSTEKAVLSGWFTSEQHVAKVEFADGSTFDTSELAEKAIVSEPMIDLTPVEIGRTSLVSGTDNNEDLVGSDQNELFMSRGGDDIIYGNGGSNVFYYRSGDGHDTIVVKSNNATRNILRFHTDIEMSHVSVTREKDDLLLRVKGGSVKIRGWYGGKEHQLDRVEFYKGDVWDGRDLERLVAGKKLVERDFFLMNKKTFNINDLRSMSDGTSKQPSVPEENEASSLDSGGCNIGMTAIAILLLMLGTIKIRRK